MATSRIPVEIDAQIGPRALEDLSKALTELGYDPRSRHADAGAVGKPELELTVDQDLSDDALRTLLRGVSDWIKQRPAPKGRFRRRKPKPVSVTVRGPNATLLGRAEVERG